MERGNPSSSCEGDRISRLPDSLIHDILSFMDIKFAVQTCVLSTRWRYIWTSLPVLKFSDTLHYNHESDDVPEEVEDDLATERFTKFVNKVLNLRDDSDIQRFHLRFTCCLVPNSEIHRWIAAAVSRNVQEIIFYSEVQGILHNFKTEPEGGYEIPPCLCACKSLTKMELQLCAFLSDDESIFLPHKMSLPRLKSLRLSLMDMSFNDEKLTNRFFSSFPSLESLIIEMAYRVRGFDNMNLRISLPDLKYFEFDSRDDGSNSEITLHAPSLSSFIFNSYMSTSFTLENLSSLVTADIKIRVKFEDQVAERDLCAEEEEICAEKKEIYAQHTMGLLRGIQNMKVLMLNDSVLKALGGAPDILDTQLPEFCNLQHLELQTYLSRDCLRSILCILKNSPNRESVSLPSQRNHRKSPLYPYCDEVKSNPENIGDYWDAGLSLPCMICHLKFVEIKGLCGCVNELKFLEILLKHATVLEKVILNSYSTEQDSHTKKRMTKFSEMLLKFPTTSKKILILLNSRVLFDGEYNLRNQSLQKLVGYRADFRDL